MWCIYMVPYTSSLTATSDPVSQRADQSNLQPTRPSRQLWSKWSKLGPSSPGWQRHTEGVIRGPISPIISTSFKKVKSKYLKIYLNTETVFKCLNFVFPTSEQQKHQVKVRGETSIISGDFIYWNYIRSFISETATTLQPSNEIFTKASLYYTVFSYLQCKILSNADRHVYKVVLIFRSV